MRRRFRLMLLGALLAPVISLAGTARAGPTPLPPQPPPLPWPQFHHDEQHTGVAEGSGNVYRGIGPQLRWQFRVTDAPEVAALTDPANSVNYRWTSSLPLADLDGDGKLEVIVTTPDGIAGPDHVIALRDRAGLVPPVEVMWIYTSPVAYPAGNINQGFDTYSPALADADDDGRPDVIIATKDGHVRALSGLTGAQIWDYELGRRTEAGPMVADLDGDGRNEVIVVTDCPVIPIVYCPNPGEGARLVVLPISPTGTITPLWTLNYPYKMDSAEPAVADFDASDGHARKAVIMGSWGGELLAAWQGPSQVYTAALSLRSLDVTATLAVTPVIRTSPLVYDFGQGQTIVFGWLPTDDRAGFGRLTSVGLKTNWATGAYTFTPRWTLDTYDTWKSSPTLLPVPGNPPLVVMGYGLAFPKDGQSGPVGECRADTVFGGVVAFNHDGSVAWDHNFHDEGRAEGNIRASAAVADLDGDGRKDVILPVGCYGKLYSYDSDGVLNWTRQLGPRSQGSPSIGDLDGDGKLELVMSSYDGQVWVFSGGARAFVPVARR
ncbi:MAG: VCBS repeat-containing protein [Thermoflexales bacterium]